MVQTQIAMIQTFMVPFKHLDTLEVIHSVIVGWLRAHLGFAVVSATHLCLQGSCVVWRNGVGIDDSVVTAGGIV